MLELLHDQEKNCYQAFCQFVEEDVKPHAARWENDQEVPRDIIERSAEQGFLGAMMPREYGGNEWDTMTYGLFTEAVAHTSTSLAGLFNVHTMVMQTLLKWGSEQQRNHYLPRMCSGELLAALALTEPQAGSDLNGLETTFKSDGDQFIINGKKRWITYGGLADVFLVFGVTDEEKPRPIAVLVDKDTPGLKVTRIKNMLGFRGSYLAILQFDDCRVNQSNLVGRPGFAYSLLAPYALDYGRISVYFTALGILRGCLEHCCTHATNRKAFGNRLMQLSTIKEKITQMGTDYDAAAQLCISASRAKDNQAADFAQKVMIAKYFSVRAANRHATNAVQILGAIGCNESHPVARYYRDSKVLEIIEGSNQVHEMVLVGSYVNQFKKRQLNRDYLAPVQ